MVISSIAFLRQIYFLKYQRSLLLTLELQAVSGTPASVQETVDIGVKEAVVGEDLVEVDVVVDAAVGHAGYGTQRQAQEQTPQQGRGHGVAECNSAEGQRSGRVFTSSERDDDLISTPNFPRSPIKLSGNGSV